MVLARYFVWGCAALGLGVAFGVSATEQAPLVTWTREIVPQKPSQVFLTPGVVVLTREQAAGPALSSLQQQLADLQRENAQQQAMLKAVTDQKIETLNQLTEERLRSLSRVTDEKVQSVARQTTSKVQGLTALAESKYDRLARETETKLEATKQVADARYTGLAQATEAKVQGLLVQTQANRELASKDAALVAEKAQAAALASELRLRRDTEQRVAALETQTQSRLQALETLTKENRSLAERELKAMQSALETKAATQLAQVEKTSAENMAALAKKNQLDLTRLQQATAEGLAAMYMHATRRAETLTTENTAALARQMADLQSTVSATSLTPAQVQAMALQAVDDAAPAFEALAYNTIKEAEDYMRTVARKAVAEKDPAMTKALGEAVASALGEEASPAAFSMRRAIVNELAAVARGEVSGSPADMQRVTRLGDGMNALEPAAGVPAEDVDAARLRLGRLLNPGVAPADNPTQLATLMPNQEPNRGMASLGRAKARNDLMDLRDYKVVVHTDNQTLPTMMSQILERAEPFAGPWQVRWRLKPENADLMNERFSLDAETTFEAFVSYLAQYLINDRGVKLTFSLFDRERVVLVSD